MALKADRALVLHGVRSSLRKRPNEHLTNAQKTFTMHQQVSSDQPTNWNFNRSSADISIDDRLREVPLSGSQTNSPSIDELEQSLSELKMQVKSLTSSLTPVLMTDYKRKGDLDCNSRPSSRNGDWPILTNGAVHENRGGTAQHCDESEWFVRPRHLVRSLGRYPALEDLGVPAHFVSPVDRVVGLTGSELSSKSFTTATLSPVDIAYRESVPVRVGAPHLIGVRALLPPQIPVRLQCPERTRSPSPNTHSRSLRRTRDFRSRSQSPAPKRSHWQQSRPQSPKPVWRPNSAKVHACGRPPPPIKRQTTGSKKAAFASLSRSYSYNPEAFGSSSQPMPNQSVDDRLSFRALDVASPSAKEISDRYEMKGPRFHYEAHKNNELLRSSRERGFGFSYGEDFSASSDFSQNGNTDSV
ncbi:uncharacterized protein LOC132382112 isoform X2 [Hypanus sabinus]|uniref:uncharacterized protein LOC132382112 isoform X2 n=1 Tax=Hypanus sabinus TaxID=79690 RepID=UPI0028C3839E|nr:uncharacterized protein LOC132382112 isoform X2 [Hypanus sabinus]